MGVATQLIHGQASWKLGSDTVKLAVTRTGGMIAPVSFFIGSESPVRPYYVAPWAEEGLEVGVPVLGPLRGDFFCMPFGGNARAADRYTVHGETATRPWSFVELSEESGAAHLTLEMQVSSPKSRVTKDVWLRPGEPVIYTQHRIEGGSEKVPLGHHATLAPPPTGRYRISTSRFTFGLTAPRPEGPMVNDEYFALPPLAEFNQLDKVPTIWKSTPTLDYSIFPGTPGFTDILSLNADLALQYSWTAAVAEEAGYLWFSIKDPGVLPTTVMWVENGGRRGAPWLGRNQCIGLEEVCGFLAEGLPTAAESNLVNQHGIPTAIQLHPDQPTVVNYLQGVLRVKPGFGMVTDIQVKSDRIVIRGSNNAEVSTPAAGEFVLTGKIPTGQESTTR